MSDILTCHVTQLLYVTAPPLNFAQVVGDLHTVLAAAGIAAPALTWDCDDIAFIDFDTARVAVAFAADMAGQYAACLTIAVGNVPQGYAASVSDADQLTLCDALAERLTRRFACDAAKSQMIGAALTSDVIDSVMDALFPNENGMTDDGAAHGATYQSAGSGQCGHRDADHRDALKPDGASRPVRAVLHAADDASAASAPNRPALKIASHVSRTIRSLAALPKHLTGGVADGRRSHAMANRLRAKDATAR